jgi:hypothetical protein
MDTQKLLEGVCELAPIINEGKKAFTESEQLKDKIIEWYGHHGTKLESEIASKGFFIWNPAKI